MSDQFTPAPEYHENSPYPQSLPQGGFSPEAGMPLYVQGIQPLRSFDFIESMKRFFTGYVRFSGRAGRWEYWIPTITICVVLVVLSFALGDDSAVVGLASLAVLLPTISISVRRLHDANLSGWWILLPYGLSFAATMWALIAVIGAIGASVGVGIDSDIDALDTAFAAVSLGSLFGSLGLLVLSGIIGIIMMLLPPKAEGVRFDRG